jgi:hypothetical protein
MVSPGTKGFNFSRDTPESSPKLVGFLQGSRISDNLRRGCPLDRQFPLQGLPRTLGKGRSLLTRRSRGPISSKETATQPCLKCEFIQIATHAGTARRQGTITFHAIWGLKIRCKDDERCPWFHSFCYTHILKGAT